MKWCMQRIDRLRSACYSPIRYPCYGLGHPETLSLWPQAAPTGPLQSTEMLSASSALACSLSKQPGPDKPR